MSTGYGVLCAAIRIFVGSDAGSGRAYPGDGVLEELPVPTHPHLHRDLVVGRDEDGDGLCGHGPDCANISSTM